MVSNIFHTLLLSCLFMTRLVVSAQNFEFNNSSSQSSSSSSPTSSFITTSLTPSSSVSEFSSSFSSSSSFLITQSSSSSFNLFTSSVRTNSSSSSTSTSPIASNTSTSSSTFSSITPIFTSSNISTLPITSSSKSSSSSSSSSSRSTTSFSSKTSLIKPSTSETLSTYTSNGQVVVTQVFLTLTSTHTSFSTKAGKHHGLSSKNKKIVAGVVVGVGVPVIILVIWLIYFFMLKGKKERYIDSQGREVIDIKHNKFVRYIWCDLFGFTFKDDADQSIYNKSNSSFGNSNKFMNRGSSKTSSNYNNSNLGVLGNNVLQMNDMRLEKENALLKEQRERGFPTNDNVDEKDHMDSSNSPVNLQDDHSNGRDIDGNFKGRNSLNTHRRIESVVTGDGFDYLDEINAKKY